jgi:hypothetical protein
MAGLRLLLAALCWQAHSLAATSATYECNVTIAGGSLSGVAAALAAADADASLQVCLLEITDWPGGQASSGGTSAIDFGATAEAFPANLPRSLADILTSPAFGAGDTNLAQCTVSTKCFLPETLVRALLRAFSLRPNLRVFLSTAVVGAARSAATGRVTQLTAVQRTPAPGTGGYDANLSAALPDWYSPKDSQLFTKVVLTFDVPPAGVVVEATEFGDVLVLSGVRVAQGIEAPLENSTTYDQGCGQATTVCFWQSWGTSPAPSPDPTPGQGLIPPDHPTQNATSLNQSLTWRRSVAANAHDLHRPYPGDTALLNRALGVRAEQRRGGAVQPASPPPPPPTRVSFSLRAQSTMTRTSRRGSFCPWRRRARRLPRGPGRAASTSFPFALQRSAPTISTGSSSALRAWPCRRPQTTSTSTSPPRARARG